MVNAEHDDLLVRLRSVPLFADLSDESLKLVADHVAEFEARRGHLLAQPGQPGAGLFILLDGRVRVELSSRTVELGPGEFFGELALLDEAAVHTGRVVSDSDIRCLALSRDDFDELLQSEPTIAVVMSKVLARRLASILR
jgi:CRP-like cAMP-binding protein